MSKTFAILSSGKVSNIITAETKEDAEIAAFGCIEYTDENPAGIGWSYDPETGLFSAPVLEVVQVIEEPAAIEAPEVIIEEPAAIEAPTE
jgi:hypothetical protein